MQKLVLTEQQAQREIRDREIASRFRELRRSNPGASDRRIVETIAAGRAESPTSAAGVRLALVRTGTIVPNAKDGRR